MANIKSGFATAADTRLYYEEAGTGPAVVLVHGFSGDCGMWDEQYFVLAERFRVIRYDLRGHGRSSLPTHDYAHAEDLRWLMDQLGLERAFVVGLSMGGWITTHFTLTHPALVAGAVLISSALIGWEWTPEWKTRWTAMTAQAKTQGIGAARQTWLEHPLFAQAMANPDTAPRVHRMVEDYSGWHWVNSDPQRAIDVPDMERLDQISAPVLIVSGEKDFEDFQMITEILQHNIPRANTLWLPTGHLVNIEAPSALNDAISGFVESVLSEK